MTQWNQIHKEAGNIALLFQIEKAVPGRLFTLS